MDESGRGGEGGRGYGSGNASFRGTGPGDLLFSAPFTGGGKGFVYVLFEHQSSAGFWLGLRLLEYLLLIWRAFLKAEPGALALPVILPVVLAQNDKVWEVPTRLADLLDGNPLSAGARGSDRSGAWHPGGSAPAPPAPRCDPVWDA